MIHIIPDAASDFHYLGAKMLPDASIDPFGVVVEARQLVKSLLADVPEPSAAVLHDAPQRLQAVLPADLLSLRIAAAGVGDAYLIDPDVHACELRSNFRLESETV